MKSLLNRLLHSDLFVVTVTYWLVAMLVIFPSYVLEFTWPRALAATAYNIVLDTAAVYFIAVYFLPRVMKPRTRLAALLPIPLFLLLSGVLYNAGYGLILQNQAAWTPTTLIGSVIRHGQSYGVLGILLVGKGYFDMQHRLLLANKAQMESELKSLKAQIDPHFLFNNLNILHALIQQDKQIASHYLSCFAGLYRYLIRHKDDDFVSLAQELKFVDDYIHLLKHRFGPAYCFHQELLTQTSLDGRYVVPATIQILVENAIKHNRGDEDNPLAITIRVRDDTVSVRNKIRPKLTPVDSAGTGLLNLRERYRILSNKEIDIHRDEFFEVLIPISQGSG